MYDPSRLGVPIKNNTVVFLGLWHSYKIACTKIHERYADILSGPFFHARVQSSNPPLDHASS